MLSAFLFGALASGVAIALLAFAAARHFRLNALIARAELLSGRSLTGMLPVRAIGAVEALMERLTTQERRLHSIHAVSGLPTREPLAARMTADGRGTLALLSSRDYDRLCAFDPQLAERLLLQIASRIAPMLMPTRFLAQVDRSHFAIWFGPDVERSEADAEIGALAYALSERILDGEREILPEIVSRIARFDAGQGTAQATISQTLSAFSVAAGNEDRANVAAINLGTQARERFQVEQDLRQAIARNQLRMQYQPLIDAARGRVCGAEALIRWEHPERGLIPPSRFIPIAETAGLSQEIGLWALNHAARDARAWQVAGLADVRVAVNVTGHQLEHEDLPLLIARTLERHSLTGAALEVELTESVALADGLAASVQCDELRRQGVHVAIDDFGTGYSSLSALRTLAFDKIKIDRAFVSGVHQWQDSQAICSSIFALGRGLGIKVLAEGVENELEYRWLRRHGCSHFQGFYFAPALSCEDFLAFARDTARLTVLLASPDMFTERLRA